MKFTYEMITDVPMDRLWPLLCGCQALVRLGGRPGGHGSGPRFHHRNHHSDDHDGAASDALCTGRSRGGEVLYRQVDRSRGR